MRIAVMDADARQKSVMKILSEGGHEVISLSTPGDGKGASFAILPLPFSRDGVHVAHSGEKIEDFVRILEGVPIVFYGGKCEKLRSELSARGVDCYDYNIGEKFLWENARLTAEAAVSLIIADTCFSLRGIDCHIVGFGRIGKILAGYLSSFGAHITVYARRDTDLACAETLGYRTVDDSGGIRSVSGAAVLINTVPEKIISGIPDGSLSDTVIFDLAGKGSLDSLHGVKIVNGLSLPARYMPDSAAKTVIDSIEEILKQR